MADIDIDPFGGHESRHEEMGGESIPLTPVGKSTWDPSLWAHGNQNVNRKLHSEGCQVQERGLMLDL